MELYTCQNVSVYEKIVKYGRHTCEIDKSPTVEDPKFREAYDWLAKALAKRIRKPADATHPIWAYNELEDGYDYSSNGEEGESCVFMTLEVADDRCVGIDPAKWACIYTDGFVYPYDADEDEYERLRAAYESATEAEIDANREQLFEVEDGNVPEILFWAINAEDIKSVKTYTCHLDLE